jgi:arginine deiminase
MRLNVTSETGKLKSVLIHLPGREIDVMPPSMMEELLFDDILYGQLAREEHRRFQQIIYFVAEQVYDLQDLLEETLEDSSVRKVVVKDFARRKTLHASVKEKLSSLSAARLAETLVGGIVHEGVKAETLPKFDLAPVPNLFFSRDPQVVLGDRIIVASMATEARQRESLLSHYVFRYHKKFQGADTFWLDQYEKPVVKGAVSPRRRATLEGGDVLVPRRDLLLVGLSERTNRAGIEQMAEALKASKSGVKTILVVEIPKRRSYMHLDTVFTIINRDECLIYPPCIQTGGSEEAKVYQLDLTKRQLTYTSQKSLLRALKKKGMDLEPISCGGRLAIDQQREQWTDGSNAFVLAPGIIVLYERNTRTAAELDHHGYHIVYEDDLLLGRTELETWTTKKYAIQIQGHELSRARGGPRCMTMPLEREDL